MAFGGVLLAGGGATAASLVTSADIKNQTIKSWDVARDGVGKSEVRSGAVGKSEIRDKAVGERELTDDLAKKVADAMETQVVKSEPVPVPQMPAGSDPKAAVANCPDGTTLLGGGYDAADLNVTASEPDDSTKNNDWRVEAENLDGPEANLVAKAVCTK